MKIEHKQQLFLLGTQYTKKLFLFANCYALQSKKNEVSKQIIMIKRFSQLTEISSLIMVQ